jgi:acetoin utilization deacetylase AcuC-like enzyme
VHTIYTARHKLHATDGLLADIYEVPARAEIILGAVRAAQLGPVVEPTDHGLKPILAVHDTDYVDFLCGVYAESVAYHREAGPLFASTFATRSIARKPKSFQGLVGYYAFGSGSPILEGTWEAAYWSAQCALTAADLVRDGDPAAYALCRPPGHHAAADLYGGYCYLNNAAIAARYLQQPSLRPRRLREETPAGAVESRVAILDVDYHHGNGTQITFYSDPSVLYCSLHAHPDEDYPYYWGDCGELGEGPGQGTNRNWPLPRGTDDARYLAALDEALAAVHGFAPRYLVVSAGFDTVAGDPEGGFQVTAQGLREIGRRIAGLELPTVLVQEGGYLRENLGESAVAFLQAFAR